MRTRLDELNNLGNNRVGPLLFATDECLSGMYAARLKAPTGPISTECEKDPDPTHRAIPSDVSDRIIAYEACANTLIHVFFVIAADPDQRAWGKAADIGVMKALVIKEEVKCPSLADPAAWRAVANK